MNSPFERRSHEAPMDFEFTNKDRDVIMEDSPFRMPTKRPFGELSTPAPLFPQPNIPHTFGPNMNVPFLMHQPPPPSQTSIYWTPKSGPVVETNDVSMEDASPPRIEMPSPQVNERPIATGALIRVFRSRQKQRERSQGGRRSRRRVERDDEEYTSNDTQDESEDDVDVQLATSPRRGRGLKKSYSEPLATTSNHNHHYTFHVSKPELSHSEIPYLLLGYLQFFFNLSLVLGFLYILYSFARAVQKDVEQKMLENTLDTLQEIATCARLYTENFCADKPSPIIAMQCQEWKACMERDASIVGRTRLLAELIGEVINSFMEPISWRTMIFACTALALGIGFVNSLLMFYRARHAPETHPVTPTPPQQVVGPPYWNPTQGLPSMVGQRKGGWNMHSDSGNVTETPSRRRRLNGPDE